MADYEVTAFEAYLDLYVLTGNSTYLDAMLGARDMYLQHCKPQDYADVCLRLVDLRDHRVAVRRGASRFLDGNQRSSLLPAGLLLCRVLPSPIPPARGAGERELGTGAPHGRNLRLSLLDQVCTNILPMMLECMLTVSVATG